MEKSNIVNISSNNIQYEHICCTMTSKPASTGVVAKKEWMEERMSDGLTFKKINVQGKAFIEYIPAKKAWVPIDAEEYMHINCFWVSEAFKNKGYGRQLLTECEVDAYNKGYKGVTAIVGNSKKPYLSDKAFFAKHGYVLSDQCLPYFELMVKRFDCKTPPARFKDNAHKGMEAGIKGIDISYTAQCPFAIPYAEMLESVIREAVIPIRLHQITTKEEAQAHICPITTYSVFINGRFYTNEILTVKKLEKLTEM